MAEIKQEETQQELFGEFSGDPKKPNRFPALHKAQKPILVNTSVEQVILVGILLILAGCFVFFLGILRGRSLTGIQVTPSRVTMPRPRPVVASPAVPKIEERPDLNKPYTIQLATYKRQDLAEKEVAALKKEALYAFIIPSGDYYQVCAGQYASKEEAKKKLKVFSFKYKDSYLRRR